VQIVSVNLGEIRESPCARAATGNVYYRRTVDAHSMIAAKYTRDSRPLLQYYSPPPFRLSPLLSRAISVLSPTVIRGEGNILATAVTTTLRCIIHHAARAAAKLRQRVATHRSQSSSSNSMHFTISGHSISTTRVTVIPILRDSRSRDDHR